MVWFQSSNGVMEGPGRGKLPVTELCLLTAHSAVGSPAEEHSGPMPQSLSTHTGIEGRGISHPSHLLGGSFGRFKSMVSWLCYSRLCGVVVCHSGRNWVQNRPLYAWSAKEKDKIMTCTPLTIKNLSLGLIASLFHRISIVPCWEISFEEI